MVMLLTLFTYINLFWNFFQTFLYLQQEDNFDEN